VSDAVLAAAACQELEKEDGQGRRPLQQSEATKETNKKRQYMWWIIILGIHGNGTWRGFHYHVVWNHYWWYADEVSFMETIIVATSNR
jgi:hypothetical protein